MKLYTKKGDAGYTDLVGGGRIGKADLRVEAYGSVDELNACLGLVLANCNIDSLKAPVITAQHRLFDLGAQLATESDDPQATARLSEAHIEQVEAQIDQASAQTKPLRAFILPGGSETAARLHLARTICRRAERRVVALGAEHPVDPRAIIYLNRLSDLLFALARLANHLAEIEDVPWKSGHDPV